MKLIHPSILSLVTIFYAVVCLGSIDLLDHSHKPSPDEVVVEVLKEPLPSEERAKRAFLWREFANHPEEEKFGSYTEEDWKKNFEILSAELLKKSEEQKLNTQSLRKALKLVLLDAGDGLAYLPVGAYQTTLDGRPIWIITVKWEGLREESQRATAGLTHIRAFAFDQEMLNRVGFVTCS